ncbi:MAG: YqgE/AlgH family protein [Tannerella sp.]|nr:YqgE/AlgH family protein [Tannerella sp.]
MSPEKGKVLISEPFLQNAFFQRSVILLVESNSAGSMGFVLNKQTNFLLNDFFPEILHLPEIPIYLGGPVQSNHLFFIQTLGDDLIPNGVNVFGNLYFDGDFNALIHYMVSGGQIHGKIKFFIGYSGWSSEQLNEEIDLDSWLVTNSSVKNIMMLDGDEFWNQAVDSFGNQYSLWKNYPKNPDLN